MGINAAQLMVTVGANTAAAEQGVMGFSRLIGMGGPLALGAVGAAAVLAGVGIASIKMAGDFQSGMTTIVTGAGESTKNLGMLSQGVLDMAMATGTSTKQLTDGLYMIESGGFRGAAALNILRAAAEGAKVGNADLGVVADATDTVLKNYGQHGLSAAQAVNALIDTVSHGKTHMEDLAAALAHILPTAAAAHVSLGDVLGAMATMTGEGVDAANAATYLRQMLIALEAPSDKSKKVLDGLGLSTQTLAAEMQLSLPRALQDITDRLMHEFPQGAYVASVEMDKVKAGTESWDTALAHMSKSGASQYVAAIRDLSGGMRQMQGMLLLTGPHLKTFNDLSALIGATAGKSGDAIAGWALVQKNFNQQFAVFGETVKVLLIELGQHLLPAAGEFVSLLTGGLKSGVGDLTGQLSALTGEGLAPADVHARHLHGAVTLLHSSVHTQLNPTLAKLNEYMQSELVPIFTKYGGQMEREMVPIMRTFGQVMTQNILPALGPLGKQFAEGFLKPAMKLGADVLPVLNPLLQALGWLFQNVLAPFIGATATHLGDFLSGIDNAITAVESFVNNPSIKTLQGLMMGMQSFNMGMANLMTGGMTGSITHALGGMFGLPHFASGGVMGQTGWATVGEQGPETVLLPGGATVLPTGAGAGSGGAVVIHNYLQVDGRTLATATARYLPQVVRGKTGRRDM